MPSTQRALIHVAGPAKAGKTTLVEALLRGLGETVICVRAERDDSLRAPKESSPKTHGELRRYAEAGASAVAHYRFPVGRGNHDDFFITNFMQDYSTAVIIEGDCPLQHTDLTVFVAPPPPAGASLLVRVQRDHAAKQAASVNEWARALGSLDAFTRFPMSGFGEPLLESALADLASPSQIRTEMKAGLVKLRAAAPPKPTKHWAVAAGYDGIEHAQLVVVNVPDDEQLKPCEVLVEEVARLRKDADVFKDVLGFRGSKIPVTAVTACLGKPKDPGLKKALARVKRAIRSAQQ